jgi:hypothetical protein
VHVSPLFFNILARFAGKVKGGLSSGPDGRHLSISFDSADTDPENRSIQSLTEVILAVQPPLLPADSMVKVQTRSPLLKDIYEVIRSKKAQQSQLGEQIEALQNAARDLEAVQHLLREDDAPIAVVRR